MLKGLIPRPTHVFPSVDVAIVFPPEPTATNNEPFHVIPRPSVNTVVPRPTHVVPFVDLAIEFPPEPTATHNDNDGLQATPSPKLNGAEAFSIQKVPFVDVTIVVLLRAAPPTATHNDNDGLQATPYP